MKNIITFLCFRWQGEIKVNSCVVDLKMFCHNRAINPRFHDCIFDCRSGPIAFFGINGRNAKMQDYCYLVSLKEIQIFKQLQT